MGYSPGFEGPLTRVIHNPDEPPMSDPDSQSRPESKPPARVSLYFNVGAHPFSPARTFLVLRNATGAELGLVRMRP